MVSSRMPRNLPAAFARNAWAAKSRKIGCTYAWPCAALSSTSNCQSSSLLRAVPCTRALNLSVAMLPASLFNVSSTNERSNVAACRSLRAPRASAVSVTSPPAEIAGSDSRRLLATRVSSSTGTRCMRVCARQPPPRSAADRSTVPSPSRIPSSGQFEGAVAATVDDPGRERLRTDARPVRRDARPLAGDRTNGQFQARTVDADVVQFLRYAANRSLPIGRDRALRHVPIDLDAFRGPAVAGDALHAQVGVVERVHEAGSTERQRGGGEKDRSKQSAKSRCCATRRHSTLT